jgi:hypothetical protein
MFFPMVRNKARMKVLFLFNIVPSFKLIYYVKKKKKSIHIEKGEIKLSLTADNSVQVIRVPT